MFLFKNAMSPETPVDPDEENIPNFPTPRPGVGETSDKQQNQVDQNVMTDPVTGKRVSEMNPEELRNYASRLSKNPDSLPKPKSEEPEVED